MFEEFEEIKENTYLMLGDTPVMLINVDDSVYEELEPSLVPFALRGTIKKYVPRNAETKEEIEKELSRKNKITDFNKESFTNYLADRILHISKSNYKKIVNTLGYSQKQNPKVRAGIAVSCHAASMSDNYWLKPVNSDLQWKDVDLKNNSLSEAITLVALHGKSVTIQGRPHTGELTNLGTTATGWRREAGETYLYKKNVQGGHNAATEINVSNILDCFNVPHAIYEHAEDEYDKNMCKCKNLCTKELNMVDATDVMLYGKRKYGDEYKYILDIDKENIYKMCIIDYLISNSDRHSGNWGFYMSSKTGNLLCCHPLFDHNYAFDREDMIAVDGGPSKVFDGKSKKEVAEFAIKNCNLKCIAPVKRDMFYNKEEYESFMSRAVELGLYRKIKPTFLQKIGLKDFEKYVPVIVEPNEKVDYNKYYKQLYEKDKKKNSRQSTIIDANSDIARKAVEIATNKINRTSQSVAENVSSRKIKPII